jgi:hypothetical protein
MATLSFRRGDTKKMDETPITDGMVFFNEENHRLYMDNGSERFQYGGTMDLVTKTMYARYDNAFSAKTCLDVFPQKTSIVDNINNALAVTQEHVPLGCLAFSKTIGHNQLVLGDKTVTGGINALMGHITELTLKKGETTLSFVSPDWKENSYIDVYTQEYKASPKDIVATKVYDQSDTSVENPRVIGGKITMTFKEQDHDINVRVIIKNY